MRILVPFFCIILLSGCSGAGLVALQALSAADVASGITTGKTVASNALSVATGKDCKIFHLFKGKNVCEDTLVNHLIDMNCEIYSWDDDNVPYCREDKDTK
tara:strand:- start:172 stop:474 length:303 start_codon:yes stop_codon:yes gene_type:complete